MIPRRLMLRNFMCYREDFKPLELDGIEIACLAGENGAGKSALLDALTWVLWGESRLSNDDDLIALGAEEMLVDLTFVLDGQDYRVTRKRSRGKKGKTELDFHARNGEGWKVIGESGVRETQRAIINTLRMDYELFVNSAYLRQGHADEFTRKEPGKRKQVLANILGLDVYERMETASKERARDLDGQVRGVDGQITALQTQAGKRELYADEVAHAEIRATQLADQLATAELILARATERVQALESRRPLRDERRRQIDRMRTDRAEIARRVEERVPRFAAAHQFLARAIAIQAGMADLEAARAELERLDTLRGDYDAIQEQRRSFAQALRDAESHIRTQIEKLDARLGDLRERAAQRPRFEADIIRLSTQLDQFVGIDRELAAARDQRTALSERHQAISQLQVKRVELQKLIDLKHDSLVSSRDQLRERVKETTTILQHEPRWQAELEQACQEQSFLQNQHLKITELRHAEHESVEQAGGLRTACETIKSQGDEINRKLALLTPETSACPLCGNPLGHDGIVHIEAEYDRQRKELRAQYAQSKRDADSIDRQLVKLRAQIAELEHTTTALPEIAGRIARLERELQNAAELRQRQNEDQHAFEEVQFVLMKSQFEPGARSELRTLESEITALGNQEGISREIRRLDARVRELEQKSAEQHKIRAQIETRQQKVKEIDTEDPAIHELEIDIGTYRAMLDLSDFAHEDRRALARADAEIAALGYTPERHHAARATARELEHWADEQRKLERAEEWIAQNQEAQQRDENALIRCDQEIAEAEIHLQALDEELRALAPAARERDEATTMLQMRRRELSVAERDLAEKQVLLRRAEDAVVELLQCERRRRTLQERKGLFDELGQAFGKKGIQAMLIETAIPEIEHEANALLGRMTDNQMHLTFETQRELRKGDVAETLEIKIADALGTRVYDAYSGGEAFRLDFAIRIALAKLLARRAGARLETLVIDEGFGSQDARGRERLVEAITSVQQDFKRILVITHIQELKDQFPVQIEITKTPQGSMWSMG